MTSMDLGFLFVVALIAVGGIVYLIIKLPQSGAISEVTIREHHAGITQDLAGNRRVLLPATYALYPGETQVATISTGKQPVERVGDDADVFATAGVGNDEPSINWRMEWGADVVLARPFRRQTGRLLGNPNDPSEVTADRILWAFESLAPSKTMDEYSVFVYRAAHVAIEIVGGQLTHRDLIFPGHGFHMSIPFENPATGGLDLMNVYVGNNRDLRRWMTRAIEFWINYILRFVGVNLINFSIEQLDPADAEVRKAAEGKVIAQHENDRADIRFKNNRNGITRREALAPNDQYGAVTQAVATHSLADAEKLKAEVWRYGIERAPELLAAIRQRN